MDYRDDDRWTCFGMKDTEVGSLIRWAQKTLSAVQWKDWLIVGLAGVVLALVAGCDFQAAQATQEAIQTADAKKAAVMGMPCTWVAQCGNPVSDCPVTARKCVSAGLR